MDGIDFSLGMQLCSTTRAARGSVYTMFRKFITDESAPQKRLKKGHVAGPVRKLCLARPSLVSWKRAAVLRIVGLQDNGRCVLFATSHRGGRGAQCRLDPFSPPCPRFRVLARQDRAREASHPNLAPLPLEMALEPLNLRASDCRH